MDNYLYILLGFFGGMIFGVILLIGVLKRIVSFMIEKSKENE